METRRDAAASTSANARLAALRTGPTQDSPAASGPMSLSEAIAAGYHARRPWWQRFGEAIVGRAPDTLRGRWTLEARAAVALACLALVGAAVGGWYYWQSQSTVIALPDASNGTARAASVDLPSGGGAVDAGGIGAVGPPSLGSGVAGDGPVGAGQIGAGVGPDVSALAVLPAAVPSAGAPNPLAPNALAPNPLASNPRTPRPLIVDVEGKVNHPGIVTLPPGSRVFEALNAAGGTAAGADATGLDLARPLLDGEQLRVGLPGAPVPPAGVAAAPDAPGAAGSAGHSGRKTKPAQPVNLNTATLDQLETIPSVGPAMAQRILDWRAEHGRFATVDQLREVKGIGDRKFATMRDSVTV